MKDGQDCSFVTKKLKTGLEIGHTDVFTAHTQIPENSPGICNTFMGRVSPQLFNSQLYSCLCPHGWKLASLWAPGTCVHCCHLALTESKTWAKHRDTHPILESQKEQTKYPRARFNRLSDTMSKTTSGNSPSNHPQSDGCCRVVHCPHAKLNLSYFNIVLSIVI